MSGAEIDISAINDNSVASGVACGAELLAFTDAVMARDADAIAPTRAAVEEELGKEAVTETVAVMTMFNVVDRIADSTGIPVDDGFTRDLRYSIGNELGMEHLSPEERNNR